MHEKSKRDGKDSQKSVIPKNRTEHLETPVFQGASLSRFSLPIVSVPTIVLPHYRVQLEQQPSNLPGAVGGHRWYMVCPTTGRRATVLYLRSGTGIFAHREAFAQQRLYFDAQLENKRFRGMSKYYSLDREWEAEWRKGRKLYYRGKPTRWHERLLKLERQTAAAAPALLRVLNGC